MKHLSDFEIEEMTQAIAALKNVHIDLMDRILEEFEQHLMAGEWVSQGGADFARQALERAVGPRNRRYWIGSHLRSRPASISCAMSRRTRSPPSSATSIRKALRSSSPSWRPTKHRASWANFPSAYSRT